VKQSRVAANLKGREARAVSAPLKKHLEEKEDREYPCLWV